MDDRCIYTEDHADDSQLFHHTHPMLAASASYSASSITESDLAKLNLSGNILRLDVLDLTGQLQRVGPPYIPVGQGAYGLIHKYRAAERCAIRSKTNVEVFAAKEKRFTLKQVKQGKLARLEQVRASEMV